MIPIIYFYIAGSIIVAFTLFVLLFVVKNIIFRKEVKQI